MNTVIYKYPLVVTDDQDVPLLKGAHVLYVAEDVNGRLVLYAHVNPENPPVLRRVWIHGTGHLTLFSSKAQSLGVIKMDNMLMWHVFVEPEKQKS